MTEPLTDLDRLLLSRWVDTVGIWDAIKELEDRLSDRLEGVVEELRPWLKTLGYDIFDVDRKYAGFYVTKPGWLNKKGDALIFISVGALYPVGFRKVAEEHPYFQVRCDLPRADQDRFLVDLSTRLKKLPGGWINEDCDRRSPAGRSVRSHGDAERLNLAQDDSAMAAFIRSELEPLLALGAEIDGALAAVSK